MLHGLIGDQLLFIDKQGRKHKTSIGICRCEVLAVGSKLIISGGVCDKRLVEEVYEFTIPEDLGLGLTGLKESRRIIGTLIPPRINHSQVLFNDFLYIIGGSVPKNPVSSCVKINIKSGKSFDLAGLPFPSMLHSSVLVDNRIYVAGGMRFKGNVVDQNSRNLYYLDLSTEAWRKTDINFTKAMRPIMIPLFRDYLFICGGWIKESQFNSKVYSVYLKDQKIVLLANFTIPECFFSYVIEKNQLKMLDYVGNIQKIYLPSLKKMLDFKFKQQIIWARRKVLVFVYSSIKGRKGIFNLPELIFREVIRFL